MGGNGEDVSSDSRWWCSGFFPGVLWYVYENGRNPRVLEYARMFTARVEREKHTTDNHDVGFMLYCSFGNGLRLTGDKSYEEVLLTGGTRSLATRFKPEVGLIRSWDHNRDKWRYPVIIDNMMNLRLLMWAADRSGDKSLRDMAVSHADKTLKHHFRPDFSSCHLVSYDTISGQPHLKQTHQRLSDSSAWSRGQAWGLYGYTCMYRLTGDARYLEQARGIAGFLINHRNMPADGIPYWDFDAPALASTPRDASAAAIMASALVELSGFVPAAEGERYMAFAEKQIRTLASPEYTAPAGENEASFSGTARGAYPALLLGGRRAAHLRRTTIIWRRSRASNADCSHDRREKIRAAVALRPDPVLRPGADARDKLRRIAGSGLHAARPADNHRRQKGD